MQETNGIKRCIIITGMSGAGKSTALNILEDQGFYPIDNLPPVLLPQLIDVLGTHSAALECGVAVVADVRSRDLLNDLVNVINFLKKKKLDVSVIFVNAANDTLVRRFETTRRRHPLSDGLTILQGIENERALLCDIEKIADINIDTTSLKIPEFRSLVIGETETSSIQPTIIVSSFGFKYGIPQDADYVLDVRFLPNPNYVDSLHHLTGNDERVRSYIAKADCFCEFITRAESMFEFIASVYRQTGKSQLHICVGCTGGQHRSVAVAGILGEHLKKNSPNVTVRHRDIEKDSFQ